MRHESATPSPCPPPAAAPADRPATRAAGYDPAVASYMAEKVPADQVASLAVTSLHLGAEPTIEQSPAARLLSLSLARALIDRMIADIAPEGVFAADAADPVAACTRLAAEHRAVLAEVAAPIEIEINRHGVTANALVVCDIGLKKVAVGAVPTIAEALQRLDMLLAGGRTVQ